MSKSNALCDSVENGDPDNTFNVSSNKLPTLPSFIPLKKLVTSPVGIDVLAPESPKSVAKDCAEFSATLTRFSLKILEKLL